ncbi:MAG: PAS domain S-box protein [Thiobacillus sp.]
MLLAVLAVLGGWGFFASLQHVADSWHDYSQSRAFSERARVAASLLTAARHLAYERGRSTVVLRGAGPVSEENWEFIDDRRQLADAALDAALANPDDLPETVASELEKQHRTIGQLRGRVDRDAALPLASRDSRLADRWYESATGFIGAIQRSVERLAADSRPGDKATRLMLLAASVLQQRITAGGEASRIDQAVAAAKPPLAETLYAIHAMRGREEQLWHDIDRLGKAADDGILRGKVEDARKQSAILRGVQDRALAGLAAPGHVRLPLEQLTAASLPALDGMSELTNLAADRAVRMTVEGEAATRLHLLAHGAWSASILVLLLLSFHYVLRHVVAPLEQVDRMLRRGGVVPAGNETRNEIERLKASAVALELLEHAVDQSSDAVFLIDEALRFRYVNDAACGSLGYSRDELLTMMPQDIDPDVTREAALAGMERILIGERLAFESRHRRKDGSLFPVEISASLVEYGGVRFNLAVARDIGECKRMEQALASRERDFRSLAENLPDNIARWDAEGRYLYINPTHERTLGRSFDEVAGTLIPDSHEQVKAAIAQVVATGQAIHAVRQPVFVNSVEELHDVSLVPEFDKTGKVVGVLGLGRDMTGIYRMQEAIAVREQELRALAESSPGMMGCFHLKPDGSVCMPYVSPNIHELFGVQPQDVAEDATPLMSLNHPDDAQRVGESIAESARTMTPWRQEYRILHPTKGDRWMEGNASPQPHPDGGVIWYGYVHDITERKGLEQSLQESREFLANIIDSIADPVFVKDRHHRWVMFNEAFCRFVGHGRDELLGKTDYDFFPEREALVFWEKDDAVFASGEESVNEEDLTGGDGVVRTIVTKKSRYTDPAGHQFIVGIILDISERKRLETDLLRRGVELRRQMDFQHVLLDALALVGMQQMVVENGRIVHVGNRKLAHGMGFTDAEIDAHPPLADIIHPDDQARVMDYYRRRMAGEPVPDSYELGLISRDGKRHEYETAVAVLPDTDPPRIVTIGKDITERKQAEQRLRDALAFTEGVINAIPDLLFELDRDGTYLNVWAQNPELLAAQKEALLGKTIPDVLAPEAAEVAMSAIREAEEKGGSFGKVVRIELPEGERWFELSVSRKPAGEEADSRFLTLSRDVTERKASEIAREAALAEAMRLAQMRSAFMAQMSHELRTPLNGILGFAQMLQMAGAMSDTQREWVKIIQQSGDHLLSLINDILDHAKLEADRMELCPGDIRLDAFLGSIAGIVRVKAEQKGVALLCEAAADLPGVVRGDEKRLRQVLLNLLANAVNFTDHGQVALRVGCPAPGRVRFEVQDSGIGIGEDQLEIIFQPFEQAGEASQRAGGTGLGLAISRKLVRLMGGDIEVESRPGEGSLFSFEAGMEAVQAEPTKPEMFVEQAVQALPAAAAEPVFAPPVPELEVLHELARRGNMRSIAQRAAYLAELDPRYGCFARQLGQMAKDYQSKAIVDFVEHYLERMPAP